jgi:uncharacterized membrane protein
MGSMMGATGSMYVWAILWSLLGLALVVTGGIVVARVLSGRSRTDQRQLDAAEPPGLQEAQATLRRRYASGEISREDYLQGKVELED